MTSPTNIENRIIDAVLSQKLAPGTRLGEQQLAGLFDCSRTLIREALTRLSTRGIVTVSARRGWYVIEPSIEEAKEAFEARRVVELGMIRHLHRLQQPQLKRLKAHIRLEKAALKGNDVGARSFLLGDFHVCLAECIGNSLLADTLRDFTARTTLIAMMYQSSHDAEQSCQEHGHIVAALESGDMAKAEALMLAHIGGVQSALQASSMQDPLAHLRDALTPAADASTSTKAAKPRRKRSLPTSDDSSEGTYLGDIL